MSEQKMDQERARVVDAMCMTWRHDFGLDRKEDELGSCGMTADERDALRRRMAQLYDHHFAQARSLPVGVPDVATLDMKNAGWRELQRQGIEPEDVELQTVWHAMYAAAPTVKAEQVPAGLGIAALIVSDVCDLDPEDDGPDCVRVNVNDLLQICERHTLATSLPAAGSAVEEVEVVGYRFFHVDHGYIFRRTHIYEGNPSLEAHSLMTVAQHERIVAALSTQQSAPELVGVPLELSRQILAQLDRAATAFKAAKPVRNELRALLASHQRGEA